MIPRSVNGPGVWNPIIAGVYAEFGSGVIAGGAVRDHLLDIDAKDIDVFVNVESADELGDGVDRLSAVGFKLELLRQTEYEEAPDFASAVRGVLDGEFLGHPVQIIARPSPDFSGETLVRNFDFNITKCWFDGDVHDTPEARADRIGRTVTLARWNSPEHVEVSRERFRRFNERNGGSWVLFDSGPNAVSDEVAA